MKLNAFFFLLSITLYVNYGCSEQTGFSSQDRVVRDNDDAEKEEPKKEKVKEKKSAKKENDSEQDFESEKLNSEKEEKLILNDIDANTLAKKCKDVKRDNYKKLEETFNYTSAVGCPWGQGDNLGKKNYRLSARVDQEWKVPLPKDALICEIDFKSLTPTISFDDFVLFHINNFVIAGSKVLTDPLPPDPEGLLTYDWLKVRGTRHNDVGTYCLFEPCQLPPSDTPGPFSVSFALQDQQLENTVRESLMTSLSKSKELNLVFTAVGDNDSSDCKHSGGMFSLEVRYLDLNP